MNIEANVLLCLSCCISCHTRIFPSILKSGLFYVQHPAHGFHLHANKEMRKYNCILKKNYLKVFSGLEGCFGLWPSEILLWCPQDGHLWAMWCWEVELHWPHTVSWWVCGGPLTCQMDRWNGYLGELIEKQGNTANKYNLKKTLVTYIYIYINKNCSVTVLIFWDNEQIQWCHLTKSKVLSNQMLSLNEMLWVFDHKDFATWNL